MDTTQFAKAGLLVQETVLEEVEEVAETPRNEPEACDTEEGIEDLGVDLNPNATRRPQVITVFYAVQTFGVAHVLATAANEEQEEHATPCYNIEAVNDDEEAQGGDGVFTEGCEANADSFFSGVFWWELIAIGIHSVGVGTLIKGLRGVNRRVYSDYGGCFGSFGGSIQRSIWSYFGWSVVLRGQVVIIGRVFAVAPSSRCTREDLIFNFGLFVCV